MSKRMLRNEVPQEMTWDLTALYKNQEEWKVHLEFLKEEISKVIAFKGRLKESPTVLFDSVVAVENFIVQLYRAGTYATLNQSVDGIDSKNQEMAMIFGALGTEFSTKLAFFESELIALDNDYFESAFSIEPRLENYRHYLTELYDKKAYQLTPETEEVLSAMGELTQSPYKIYQMSKASDMLFDDFTDSTGATHPNSFALFEGKYEFSSDASIRESAYNSFVKTLERYKNTYAAVYGTEVKKQVALSRLRGYSSVTEMLLRPQQVTEEMYLRQIDVIYNDLAPHMRRYANLLKEALNLEQLHFYDLKAPMDTSYDPPATYEEAKTVVLDSLQILGDEYMGIMNRAFNERWIDVADNVGKSTGAFCASPYAAHPYILVTFQNNMRDAFTLTHELGHAGHFYMANGAQSFFNTRPSTYCVEAPSTMNEMILGRYLMAKSDDPKMKKWVILQFMGTYYHNFVTHLLEAAFQKRVYDYAEKGTPLTAKLLCETKLDVLKGFWGDAVEIDDAAGMTWMRQPHYYMGLYPYTYSAGLTASTAVSEMIFDQGKPAVDQWIKALKLGGKLKPLELLKVAGIDMTTDVPLKKAVAYVGRLIDELETLF